MTTLAIPLAIEALHLGVEIYKNPSRVKDNFLKAKIKILEAFAKNPDTNRQKYKERLLKNIARIALGALFIVFGSASVICFLAPETFSIPIAIIAIQVFGYTWKRLCQVHHLLKNTTDYLKDAFHQRKDESLDFFRQRRFKAIRNIVGCTFIFATSLAIIYGTIYVGCLFANAKNVWQLSQALPFQSPIIVFLEYATLSAAHTSLAVHAWRKDTHGAALFHVISAITGIAFPICYLIKGGVIRLHHSFIGLGLQLLPWRPIQYLGSVITFDSFLNSYFEMQGIIRGEVVKKLQGYSINQYDYQNALLEHLPFAITALSSLCLLASCVDDFTRKQPKAKSLVSFQ